MSRRRAGVLVCVAPWVIAAAATILIAAPGATASAQQAPEPGSDVAGFLMPPRGPMPLVGIPSADQQAVRSIAERLWAIALRNPALNRPIGFNLKPGMVGHGYALPGVPRDVPYTCSASGYFYWYVFQPGINRVAALPVAMQAFSVYANRISVVFTGLQEWHSDAAGPMYWEPRELRRVGGYPQYDNGILVLTNSSRPLWTPVPRERLLRWELSTQRAGLEDATKVAGETAGYDPQAILDAWLRDRPKRQRASDEMYQATKKRDPKLAEEIRARAATAERATEQALRGNITRHTEQRPLMLRQGDQRRHESEVCVAYLEDELKRLSPVERAAPGYVSVVVGRRGPGSACSAVVDANAPGARRIVEQNWGFFDRTLPRTSVQAILIDYSNFESNSLGHTGFRYRVYERLRDGMDHHAFAAMLAPR